MPQQTKQVICTVVHSIPGRVRLRFPACTPDDIISAAELFETQPEVSSVRWSAGARSLTVAFDPSLPFTDLAIRLPGAILKREFDAPAAPSSGLPPLLVTSLAVLATAAGLGAAVQLAASLSSNRAPRRHVFGMDAFDAVELVLTLLKGDLIGAGLSVTMTLAAAALLAGHPTVRTRNIDAGKSQPAGPSAA
jgi:hypothetical protein